MNQSLDDIIAERAPRGGARGGRRDRHRDAGPRDGIRKPTRDDHRNIDRDWVHDKFDDDDSRRPSRGGRDQHSRRRPSFDNEDDQPLGAKIRVDNLHYELTEEDLRDLFTRIGPIANLEMLYDRAGRSEGRAFATYKSVHDANEAIRQFNGANANGQPIRLTIVSSAPRGPRTRNPFDNITRGGGRSLADRITFSSRRRDDSSSRSASPRRNRVSDVSKPPPEGIDRYVPGQRTRSPRARRQDSGRRPGARGERGDRNSRRGQDSAPRGGGARPKKTQEELDKEMEDYFGSQQSNGMDGAQDSTVSAPVPAVEADIDMAE